MQAVLRYSWQGAISFDLTRKFDCWVCSADVLLGVGQMNLPRVETRPLTEAHSPDLATKHRAAHPHPHAPPPAEPDQGFKAQPLNKKILEGPVCSPMVHCC